MFSESIDLVKSISIMIITAAAEFEADTYTKGDPQIPVNGT